MDILSLLGIIVGFGMLIFGFLLEGGSISALVLLSPAVIVFGGTIGAVLVGLTVKEITSLGHALGTVFSKADYRAPELIDRLVQISETARREGLLSLERVVEAERDMDPFLKKGILLMVDATDLQKMREVLETDVYVVEQQKKVEISIFEQAGGFSPTMGIIGTVMGLIQVLGNMDANNPGGLAEHIAVAFIATLYGVSFANLLYLPIANKLKLKLKYYKLERELIIEGLVAINTGENPKRIRERLNSFLQFDLKAFKKYGGNV